MRKQFATAATAAIIGVMGSATVTLAGDINDQSMVDGFNGYYAKSISTIGQTYDGYTPPGILDGMGAISMGNGVVRLFTNHELLNFRGYEYQVADGNGGTFGLIGARVSYYDIDVATRQVIGSDIAIKAIYDGLGNRATDNTFLANNFAGLSRFCSASLFEAGEFGDGRGLENPVFMTGEEDGGFFNGVGGAQWALDVMTGDFWQLSDLGRGAWENTTIMDTGSADSVAVILMDDSSPFDFDGDDEAEAVPLYLYVGDKDPEGDFPARNGFRGGQLYVWVSDTGERSPLDFNSSGTLQGTFVPVDNAQNPDQAQWSEDGKTGFDEFGYPTQSNLVSQAEAIGAFGFSRPEDIATNPVNGAQAVFVSTGVDTYAVDPASGNGVDTFGTVYTIDLNFDGDAPTGSITILYDGDADPTRALRSPDNLDWADNGLIYVQEDRAETDTLSGDEILFGDGAVNPNEAGIVVLDPADASITRIANIDRDVVLDASLANPAEAFDVDLGVVGAWESSGIVDVSSLFGRLPGELFLFNVQAHGIEDQTDVNSKSRINDNDLVEGGQLLFLGFCPADFNDNGSTEFSDLVQLLSSWGECDECDEDLDGSGSVGILDVLDLLARWGSCI